MIVHLCTYHTLILNLNKSLLVYTRLYFHCDDPSVCDYKITPTGFSLVAPDWHFLSYNRPVNLKE
jgi:hypothetical protein